MDALPLPRLRVLMPAVASVETAAIAVEKPVAAEQVVYEAAGSAAPLLGAPDAGVTTPVALMQVTFTICCTTELLVLKMMLLMTPSLQPNGSPSAELAPSSNTAD